MFSIPSIAVITFASDVLPLLSPPPMPTSASASASTSDQNLLRVNLFRTQIYYPTVPFLQSVTDSLMETVQEGDGGGRRGNPKERTPT
jgi:hypothetical protein